jgi:hypothetical protein
MYRHGLIQTDLKFITRATVLISEPAASEINPWLLDLTHASTKDVHCFSVKNLHISDLLQKACQNVTVPIR